MSVPAACPPTRSTGSATVVSVLVVAIAALSTAHLLPGGICFSDSGGLQLASATLGITHPPGYVVYTTFGYLVSRLLPFDPAFTVTLLFWLMCLIAFAWIPAFQARLGGSTWLGGTVALGLLLHTNVRQNFLAPEVYGPTLFVLVAGTLAWARFLHTRSLMAACLTAMLFGIAWISRPPTVLMLPFVLLSYGLARRRLIPATRGGWKRAALVTALAIAPALYTFVYLLLRDTPTTDYNYLAQYDWEHDNLPDRESGLSARMQRAYWLVSAAQYRENVRISLWGTFSKLRWVRNRLWPEQPVGVGLISMMALLGMLIAWRHDRALTVLVLGLGISSLAFACLYRVYDLAADLLPLIFAVGTFATVALSTVLARTSPGAPFRQTFRVAWPGAGLAMIFGVTTWPCCGETVPPGNPQFKLQYSTKARRGLALTAFMLVAAVTIVRGVLERGAVMAADASDFLADAGIDALPRNAVILAGWHHATPLWYARLEYAHRPDITVVCAARDRWHEMTRRFPNRDLFAVEAPEVHEPFEAVPRGSLWSWRRQPDP